MNHLIPSSEIADNTERRQLLIATGVAGGVAAISTTLPFIATFAPSERAKAMGSAIEVDVAGMAPGSMTTVEWHGKPVWVVRRTQSMIEALKDPDPRLADPKSEQNQQPENSRNIFRSVREEFFVAIGVCTHLGCSPAEVPAGTANPSVGPDWKGGFFCPCHGSTFDGAGRVFSNKPAPTNLEIPPYRFLSDTRILIGEEAQA